MASFIEDTWRLNCYLKCISNPISAFYTIVHLCYVVLKNLLMGVDIA